MHYNRRERRRLAKQLGILKPQSESQAQATERRKRSREAGDQIHRQFLAENEVRLREAAAEREANMLESLTERYGADKAKEIMDNNAQVERARRDKKTASKVKTLAIAKATVTASKAAEAEAKTKSIERYKRAAARNRQEKQEKADRIKILRAGKRR